MPFIETDRGRFFYRQAAGDRPTLVFLHGNLGASRWWRPTLDRLPQGWRGLAPDAIGYGHSDRSERLDRYAISAQVLDLAALCEAWALPTFHLIAHSTATPVAIEYALAFPDQVQSLALVGPVPTHGVQTPPDAYPYLERLSQDRAQLGHMLHACLPALPAESDTFNQLLDDAADVSPVAFVATTRALDAWAPGERLRQLTLPVILFRGEHDIMLSEADAHATLLSIPGANNLESFHGAGHGVMVEAPDALIAALIAFISQLD